MIATKHQTNKFGYWSIAPDWYFRRHGRIPDTKASLNLPGLEEVMDHTLHATDGSDGRKLLLKFGFHILENPVWYFQRKDRDDDLPNMKLRDGE